MKKPAFAAISLLLALTLCGCGTTSVPQTTPPPSPAQTATTAPTSEITSAPTPEVTVDAEAELKSELNQNIHDFLNYEGEFTEINTFIVTIDCVDPDSPHDSQLGITLAHDGWGQVQGLLLDYFMKDDNTILVVGFNDKNGQRFVTMMEIYNSILDKIEFPSFYIQRYPLNSTYSDFTMYDSDASRKELFVMLEKLKGRGIEFILDYGGKLRSERAMADKEGYDYSEKTEKLQELQEEYFNRVIENGNDF